MSIVDKKLHNPTNCWANYNKRQTWSNVAEYIHLTLKVFTIKHFLRYVKIDVTNSTVMREVALDEAQKHMRNIKSFLLYICKIIIHQITKQLGFL